MAILPNAKLTGEARAFQWLVSLGFILIFLDLVFNDLALPLYLPASAALFGGFWGGIPQALDEVGRRLIGDLPAIAYLFGLSAAHDLLEEVAQGRLFDRASARSLGRVGAALLTGALAAAVISPTLVHWIDRQGPFDLALETETLVIAAIGGTLAVVAHMVARAGALQSELREII